MGNKPVIQHYVPQFYLKHFCIPETCSHKNPQVWVFPREHEKDLYRAGVTRIAAKRYLYSPIGVDGESRNWETEEKLSELESILSPRWGILADDFFDFELIPSMQKILALFISTLYLRNPKRIDDVKDTHRQIAEFFEQFPEALATANLIEEFKDFKNASEDDHQRMFVNNLNSNSVLLAEILLTKRWSILVSDSPAFITSDNPVIMVNQDRETFGFNTEGTVIFFPLSPTRLLTIGDWLDNYNLRYYELDKQDPSPYNYLLWVNANSCMFTSLDVDSVLQEIVEFADSHNNV